MKVINIPQNTEEWREFRRGKSGGSGLHDLYPSSLINIDVLVEYCKMNGIEYQRQDKRTKKPKLVPMSVPEILENLSAEEIGELKARGDKKDAFYKLVAERIARPITPNDYEDRLNGERFSMMARGHLLEPEAVAEFERRSKRKVNIESVVWQRDSNPNSIVSPDAVVDETEAVEIKCPDSHRIIRALDEDTYPSEYHEQVVKYFMVNEKLEVLHFVLYTDVMPSLPYLQFDIFRRQVESDIKELTAFEDAILEQVKELEEKLAF